MRPLVASSQSSANREVDLEYVDRGQFCKLALSNRKLVRSDKRHLGLRGLLDPKLGKCYVIAESDLFAKLAPRIATS